MNPGLKRQLDIMTAATQSHNMMRFIQARKELEQLLEQPLEKAAPSVPGPSNPLDEVCSVAEYCEQHPGMYKVAVHRMIASKELQARKSGGVWLIRMEKAVVL